MPDIFALTISESGEVGRYFGVAAGRSLALYTNSFLGLSGFSKDSLDGGLEHDFDCVRPAGYLQMGGIGVWGRFFWLSMFGSDHGGRDECGGGKLCLGVGEGVRDGGLGRVVDFGGKGGRVVGMGGNDEEEGERTKRRPNAAELRKRQMESEQKGRGEEKRGKRQR
ncbi:hypothetical protein Tco_0255841 [Tanacetum coccineum]